MRFAAAILASVAIHAALAALAVFGLSLSDNDDRTNIALDIGAVELSFAEKERDEMPIAPMPPAPPPSVAEPMPPPVSHQPPPPPLLDDDGLVALPPEVALRTLPEAPEPEVKFEILEVKEPPEKKAETEKKPENKPEKKPDAEKKPEPKPDAAAPQSAPREAPKQARVDVQPRSKKKIKPVYPDGARRRGEEGDVVVEISVDENGDVADVKVVTSSGFKDLDEAARKAAKSAKFIPARRGSRPVASAGRLTISFKLTK